MSAASESNQSAEVLAELFNKLSVATPEDRDTAAANVSSFLNGSIIEHDVPAEFFQKLAAAIKDKKSAVNALEAVAHIASQANLSPSVEPYIVDLTEEISTKAGDKQVEVREVAAKALLALAKAVTPTSIKVILPKLTACLSSTAKWTEKIAILDAITALVDTAKDQLALRMPELIPVLSEAMWDTKPEVKKAATATMTKCTATIDNKDIEPFIPKLISSIAKPEEVSETVHVLGATTFVSEVTTAALSIMVPLLSRGLAVRDTAIKRKAAVIVDNMCKLVDDPQVVAPFMEKMLPALKGNYATIADPEARDVTLRALNTLRRVGAVGADDVPPEVSTAGDVAVNLAILKDLVKDEKIAPRFELVETYVSAIAGDLIDERKTEVEDWYTNLTPFLTIFLHEAKAKAVVESFRTQAVANIPKPPSFEDEDDEGEDLCNCEFSLAYGAKILLNKTQFRLKRNRRYGLCGPNGSGKSTLMRAIANGQVEGFPTQDECKTVYVEHDIDGTEADTSVVDFVYGNGEVATREEIVANLREFGFSDEMINMPIQSLSGGWKMKLALARAVLKKADILLLDEPTNHLDTVNVAAAQPGAVVVVKQTTTTADNTIALNEGRARIRLQVTNKGDRPVQVGSHYHMIETNPQLLFDRKRAYGFRLDIPAGTSVRFEPGDTKTVQLVAIGGHRIIRGGNNLASGVVDLSRADDIVEKLQKAGFAHAPEPAGDLAFIDPVRMTRAAYQTMLGPTTGDVVRLGATDLWIQVEKDLTTRGDECKFGGGKTLREGMGQASGRADKDCLDLVITNALILDWTGIYKADIGVKEGMIVGIGKAGNPDVMDGVSPDNMVVGSCTEVVAGENKIITAGAIDTHIHLICPQQAYEAIASGVTTMLGGGTGPTAGTSATTCTPGAHYMKQMLQACDELPVNYGITGKGNDSDAKALREQVIAGACGLKLHEDWGTTPAAIDACLTVCDELDVQCLIHTDTLNESGFVESTVAAFKQRTIHTYHTEGAGGGHAPDIISVVGEANVLPSSTNPTRPYTVNTLDEHLDMLMVCHHLSKNIPEDVAFAESRIRAETIAAEDVMHDLGAISMLSSDSQAMGRCGEVVLRTWNTAHKNKVQRGPLAEDAGTPADNFRAKRYVSKYTINPALAQGFGHLVGSVEVGKLADLVVWDPAWFATKPTTVIKSGLVAYAMMGDPNASIPTVQPILARPMFAPLVPATSVLFVSQASITHGVVQTYGLRKRVEAVRGCRAVSKKDMRFNDATPAVSVDPEAYTVQADGVLCTAEPSDTLPLTQQFYVF